MTDFMIHFLICNLFIGVIIILLFGLKRIFRNTLTGRTQYNLWFLLLALLAVPFLPVSSGQPAAFLARLPFGVRGGPLRRGRRGRYCLRSSFRGYGRGMDE